MYVTTQTQGTAPRALLGLPSGCSWLLVMIAFRGALVLHRDAAVAGRPVYLGSRADAHV